jgi:hypothetical protein
LTWHSGAGADQVLDEDAARGCGVAKLKTRKQFGDGCVPGNAMFIDEFGEQQRVIAFVFEAIMNSVSPSGFSVPPSSFTPNPPAKTTLPS